MTKIEGVKGILMENIERLMDREEKISLLVEKTSEMQTQSFAFSQKSTELKRKLCWRNFRLYIVIAVLLMVRVWIWTSSHPFELILLYIYHLALFQFFG